MSKVGLKAHKTHIFKPNQINGLKLSFQNVNYTHLIHSPPLRCNFIISLGQLLCSFFLKCCIEWNGEKRKSGMDRVKNGLLFIVVEMFVHWVNFYKSK